MKTPLKYEELYETLRKKLSTMSSGSRLPSVRSLMKRYHVSLQTVNSALKKLENENLIIAKRGSGIYVSDHRATKLIVLHRSRHSSYHEDTREASIRKAVHSAGWHLITRRHEAILQEPSLSFASEPKACAHIVSQDLANLKLGLLNQLIQQNVPIVLLTRESDSHQIDYVTSNEQQIISLLIKHLRQLGHRHLALLVNEPSTYLEIRHNVRIFGELTELMDLPPPIVIDCHTEPGQKSSHAAYNGLKKYIENRNQPSLPFTALMVTSSAGGFGALRAFHELNIEIPGQCSVVSFESEEQNSLSIPSLTDAGTPIHLWGKSIVNLLQQRFDGDSTPSLGFKLPVELTIRESTCPASEIFSQSLAPNLNK